MLLTTRRMGIALVVLGLIATSEAKAGPTVVTFSSLFKQNPPGLSQPPVPDGYGGINWGGEWGLVTDPHYGFLPLEFGGGITAANGSSFQFVTPQIFDGAYFARDNRNGWSDTIMLQLYDDNALVATSSLTIPPFIPGPEPLHFLSSGYSGLVDTVVVSVSYEGVGVLFRGFAMDGVTYGPVPEPSSLVMTGMVAFSGLGYWGWRRRKAIPA